MYRRRLSSLSLLLVLACTCVLVAQTARHPMTLDDLARFRNVGDPQISPDGKFVAYAVSTVNVKDDKSSSHIWMVGIDGSVAVGLSIPARLGRAGRLGVCEGRVAIVIDQPPKK